MDIPLRARGDGAVVSRGSAALRAAHCREQDVVRRMPAAGIRKFITFIDLIGRQRKCRGIYHPHPVTMQLGYNFGLARAHFFIRQRKSRIKRFRILLNLVKRRQQHSAKSTAVATQTPAPAAEVPSDPKW